MRGNSKPLEDIAIIMQKLKMLGYNPEQIYGLVPSISVKEREALRRISEAAMQGRLVKVEELVQGLGLSIKTVRGTAQKLRCNVWVVARDILKLKEFAEVRSMRPVQYGERFSYKRLE